jgi:hypothetical protein
MSNRPIYSVILPEGMDHVQEDYNLLSYSFTKFFERNLNLRENFGLFELEAKSGWLD